MNATKTCGLGENMNPSVLVGLGGTALAVVGGAAFLYGRKVAKRRFRRVCDEIFREVDADDSGTVDAGELYVAVLLVYLAVNRAVRVVCAVKPPSRAAVDRVQAILAAQNRGPRKATDAKTLALSKCRAAYNATQAKRANLADYDAAVADENDAPDAPPPPPPAEAWGWNGLAGGE